MAIGIGTGSVQAADVPAGESSATISTGVVTTDEYELTRVSQCPSTGCGTRYFVMQLADPSDTKCYSTHRYQIKSGGGVTYWRMDTRIVWCGSISARKILRVTDRKTWFSDIEPYYHIVYGPGTKESKPGAGEWIERGYANLELDLGVYTAYYYPRNNVTIFYDGRRTFTATQT